MTKLEFLLALSEQLSALPKTDRDERLKFYSEMIEDRAEDGLSEEEAVATLGSPDEIAAELAVERVKPKRRKAWEIVLLVLGSPVWLSLLIAAVAVALALYVSLWALAVSLWAVFGALIGCAVGTLASGVGFMCGGNVLSGLALVGGGLLCGGCAIFLFYGCLAATKGMALLTKKAWTCIKGAFVKGEDAQ